MGGRLCGEQGCRGGDGLAAGAAGVREGRGKLIVGHSNTYIFATIPLEAWRRGVGVLWRSIHTSIIPSGR